MKHTSSSSSVQVVLAAGLSSRMGTSKPLLRFDGKTALQLVLDAGTRGGCESAIVVVGHEAERVRRQHREFDDRVEWIVNADPGGPQLRSLQLALATAPSSFAAFFIHLVDYPLASTKVYCSLLEAIKADPDQHTVFIPSIDRRRGHPILCRWVVAKKLLALPSDRTARDVINSEAIAYVATNNAGVTRDMDTPDDYEALLALYRSDRDVDEAN